MPFIRFIDILQAFSYIFLAKKQNYTYLIHMDNTFVLEKDLLYFIEERLALLEKLHEEKNSSLKQAPEGTLRISRKNEKQLQYYIRTDPKDTLGKYINVKNRRIVEALAQKDYDRKVLQASEKEIKLLKSTIAEYKKLDVDNKIVERIIEKFNPGRKELIKALRLSDSDYAKQWQNVNYQKKSFSDNFPEYFTQRGDRVRSKSEIIIADLLYKFRIPYRYEYPLLLKKSNGDKITVYPDFTCLDVKNRKEYFWEHLGMLDNAEYAEKSIRKLHLYESNGIYTCTNLITTVESSKQPINSRQIEKFIRCRFSVS